VAFLIGYVAYGIFPLEPIEYDSPDVARGIHRVSQDWDSLSKTYRPYSKIGIYALVSKLQNITGLSAYHTYGYFNIFACIVFIASTVFFVFEYVNLGAFKILSLLLISFPEIWILMYVPNASVSAAALAFLSILALLHLNGHVSNILAGFVFGLSGLFRADVALISLAFPIILWVEERNVVKETCIFAVAAVSSFLLAFAALTDIANISQIFSSTSGHFGDVSVLKRIEVSLRNFLLVLNPVFVLSFWLGFSEVINNRKYVLALSILPTLLVVVFYSRYLTTPKYFLYAYPFWAIISARGFYSLYKGDLRERAAAKIFMATAIVFYLTIGLQIKLPNKPWIKSDSGIQITEWKWGGKNIRLSIGPSTAIPTGDGLRLVSGVAFYPLVWRQSKELVKDMNKNVSSIISKAEKSVILFFSGYADIAHVNVIEMGGNIANKKSHGTESIYYLDGKKVKVVPNETPEADLKKYSKSKKVMICYPGEYCYHMEGQNSFYAYAIGKAKYSGGWSSYKIYTTD
jgi:hypothetical protein